MTDSAIQPSSQLGEMQSEIEDPRIGLPEHVFLFISRVTPLINVDLLIQDSKRRTLLTWRDDNFYGPGWHIPGGVIRYKESTRHRIHEVARLELGVEVDFEPEPICVLQSISAERADRAHFISLLYRCRLKTAPNKDDRAMSETPHSGQWLWHEHCPVNIISEQQDYSIFFGKTSRGHRILGSLASLVPSRQLIRYLIVGTWNTAFAYGIFAILTAVLDKYIPASYMAASLLGSVITITASFLSYKWFVFKTKGNYLKEWVKCMMVYSSSIALSLLLLPLTVLLVTHITQSPKSAPYIAGAVLTVFHVAVSFVGHKKFSFRNAQD